MAKPAAASAGVPSAIAQLVRISQDSAARAPVTPDSTVGSRQRGAVEWISLCVPLVIVLAGAWHDRWVQEDAFINFRIIDNLLAGHGPVFNVGERVEAYSDPLWLFVLAGAHEVVRGVSLAWLSVTFGLLGTGTGVVLGGRAVQRLVGGRGEGAVLPLGLLVFSVVAGVWEFATSGLEMSMVFAWLGLGFWLLVRVEERRDGATWCAFVLGLGVLIRPELALMSVVLLASLLGVVAAPGWRGPGSAWRKFGWPLVAALALPVGYQLWRMAYFALIVPNTALAKAAGGSWWSQGLTYLWNFVAPYTLWLPLALAGVLIGVTARRWWTRGQSIGAVVLVAPVVAAAADTLYVVHVGGDYQHARLLLPAFFATCLPLAVTTRELRSPRAVAVIAIVVWAAICAGWLRYSTGGWLRTEHGIADERAVWVHVSGDPHPIEATDYPDALGLALARLSGSLRQHSRQALLVGVVQTSTIPPAFDVAHTELPVSLIADLGAIGYTGFLAGPNVYVFDNFSLANPIGSHLPADRARRPGHQKYIGPDWMVARFGTSSTPPPAGSSRRAVDDARSALHCGTLSSYLHAITAPMTFSRALSDVVHSFTYTRFTVPSAPAAAARELCH